MSFSRAASVTAALALLVWSSGGSISLSGQAPAARGRAMETYRGRRVIAREVLVRFRGTPTAASVAALDLTENERFFTGVRRLRARRGGVAELIAALAARPDVEYVEPNYVIDPARVPSDPYFPYQTALLNPAHPGADLHASGAWDLATGSRVGVIGLIDSGVDYNHPDLAANIWSAPASFTVTISGQTITCPAGTHGFNAITLTCDPMDDQGHGTAMAGIIGAQGNNGSGVAGVNWSASIMPIKFIDASAVGSYGDAIRAIDFAIQISDTFGTRGAGVRVLSASWRGTAPSPSLSDAVDRAGAHDMLLVAAAGNDATDIDAAPVYPAALPSPTVLAVGATTVDDQRESYSNYGAASVDLAAPGTTYTTLLGGGFGSVSGTSASAALVSGAASLILSRCALSTPQLRSLLLDTVDIVAAPASVTATGGRVNLERALTVCSGANLVPSIAIVHPLANQSFLDSDPIEIDADAFDPDGAIVSVDFYLGSTWIARDTQAPFSIPAGTWPPGTYYLTAVAIDNAGAAMTSAVVPITVRPASVNVPTPWQFQDIGATGAAGQVSGSAAAMTVSGAGADIWDNSDAFTYVYQPLRGDGEIVGRVSAVEYVDAWTKAGVMLRESLAPNSAHAFMLVSAANGLAYQRRLSTGATSLHTGAGGGAAPAWVKLSRSGSTITASTSVDGAVWTVVGSDTVGWSSTIYAGLAVTSHHAGVTATAVFDSIALIQTGVGLPSGWASLDVGAVGVGGSAGVSSDTFTLRGAGADIWGTADAFQFAYTTLAGDGQMTARVASLDGVAPWSKAGVMIRATLDPQSAYGYALVSQSNGAAFQRRLEMSAEAIHSDGGGLSAPVWLRITRIGQTVTAATSFDGGSWNVIATDTIALGASAFVGLAVTSHDATQAATATFDNVSVTTFAPPPDPGPAPLPPGWASADVGAVGVSGDAHETGGAFVVTGSGADIWGTADAFQFVYTTLPGDGTITARVASVDGVRSWTKAGVMLRQSLDPSSPQAFSLISAAKGQAFQRRPTFGALSTSTSGPFVTAPQWVRLIRSGTLVTALTSTDGVSWTVVGSSDSIAFGGPVYAGLAVSSHEASLPATAVFTDVRITP
jgi:subtilisin family serine protease